MPELDGLLFLVKDPHISAKFYGQLGFDISEESDEFAVINTGDVKIRCQNVTGLKYDKESGMEPKGLGVFAYLRVAEIDKYYQSLVDKGLRPSSAPSDQPWGNREFVIRDPDRYKLVMYYPLK